MKPGTLVRCVYRGDRIGLLLSQDDPKAWANSLAFPVDNPDPIKVREHVVKCKSQGMLDDSKQPVLWNFTTEQKVYWDYKLTAVED